MNNKRYLIIPQNWLGDIIMTQCLIKKIHKEEPLSKIDLLVSKNFSPIVKRMPEVIFQKFQLGQENSENLDFSSLTIL